uniref:Yippee domain-containing protein n=1 Tax=Brassica campestris TaxID=3711 RepID=A0A3P6CA36_BRACM|nr:unnamed protein product [Brassica rapa]
MGESKTLPKYFCRNCENPLALGEESHLQKICGSFRGSFYVFARDERGGWTQDWEKIVNRIVRGGRCDV